MTQFDTDMRLWKRASLVLFVASFWIPWVPPPLDFYPVMSPVRLASILWDMGRDSRNNCCGPYTVGGWVLLGLRQTYFLFPAVLGSVSVGWALQGAIVVGRKLKLSLAN